jgi:hypothetical protein
VFLSVLPRKKEEKKRENEKKKSSPYLAVDHLSQTVPFLLGQRLRVGLEGCLDHRDRISVAPRLGGLARGFFRCADERDLRVREARGRHRRVVEHVRAAAHVLDSRDSLGRRSVREHVLAC